MVLQSRHEKNLEKSHASKTQYGTGGTGDRLVMRQGACTRGTFHFNVFKSCKIQVENPQSRELGKQLNLQQTVKTTGEKKNYVQ